MKFIVEFKLFQTGRVIDFIFLATLGAMHHILFWLWLQYLYNVIYYTAAVDYNDKLTFYTKDSDIWNGCWW